jgi:hypothetical protein
MSGRRAHFSQRDLQAAMRAAKKEGMEDRYAFKIVDNALIVIPLNPNGAAGAALDGVNPWDQVLNNEADKKRAS